MSTLVWPGFAPAAIVVTSPENFRELFETARENSDIIRESTSVFDLTAADRGALFLVTNDGLSGFVVRSDGELTNVFSTVKGRGDTLVSMAVNLGATHLDCFDGYLPSLYSRHGFHRVTSLPNWTEGGPDVVFMARHGHFLEALAKAES